jgi:hypothetical protein
MIESRFNKDLRILNGQCIKRDAKRSNSTLFYSNFSTFAYAILFSSLSLYITKQLGLSSTTSNSIVGLFLYLITHYSY